MNWTVRDLMTEDVHTCAPSDTLDRAAKIMWDHDCGCVPVVDLGNRVMGMVTDRDGFIAAFMQGRPLHEITVESAMARKVFVCRATDDIEMAEQTMQHAQIRRLPVVDSDRRIIGIISLGDIAQHLKASRWPSADGLGGETLAKTLAAISGPHHHDVVI